MELSLRRASNANLRKRALKSRETFIDIFESRPGGAARFRFPDAGVETSLRRKDAPWRRRIWITLSSSPLLRNAVSAASTIELSLSRW